eukprot:TRINITY_DN32078_c0_g1_i1.p1 TRINITY_DN32078_c0_g1~~TRINITY_DN32078_c0_g1_i1.p1  ORF type:complete len:677 (-),score=100.92 TRINITY_DN32078_c0_g1_i1:181-2133(-)
MAPAGIGKISIPVRTVVGSRAQPFLVVTKREVSANANEAVSLTSLPGAASATALTCLAFAASLGALRKSSRGQRAGLRLLGRRAGASKALTVLEINERQKPLEGTLRRELRELFGGKARDMKEEFGVGKVTSYNKHKGFGVITYQTGTKYVDIPFDEEDVDEQFLYANDGKVPRGIEVEFEVTWKDHVKKRAINLRFSVVQNMFELGLSQEVVEGAANALGLDPRKNPDSPSLITPAPVQSEAIPKILAGDDVVIAAETGSGKTLAYQLPLVQTVKKWANERNLDYGLAFQASSPLALVICPTRELAQQSARTLKLICHHARLRVRCVTGGSLTWKSQLKEISQIVDVLVCTPDRALKFHKAGELFFKDVRFVAIDEADFILTQGFDDVHQLLRTVSEESRHSKTIRQTLVTASITKPLWKVLSEDPRWRNMRVLESRALHKPQQNCKHVFIWTKGRDKMKLLAQMLQPELQGRVKPKQTLVFCNTIHACRSVFFQLQELYKDAKDKIGTIHKEMLTEERNLAIGKFARQEVAIMVCTDIAQRGLDLPTCEHVVCFDFPLNSIDYLHRAGRTARFGDFGKVTSLVKKGDKYLAKALERSVQLGKPIHNLSADRRDYLRGGSLSDLLARHPRATREERGLPPLNPYAGGLR